VPMEEKHADSSESHGTKVGDAWIFLRLRNSTWIG
jgi:hypothetical protein